MRPLAFRAGIGHEKQKVARLDATDILKYPTQSTPKQHGVSLNEKPNSGIGEKVRHAGLASKLRNIGAVVPITVWSQFLKEDYRWRMMENDGEAGKFYQLVAYSVLDYNYLQPTATETTFCTWMQAKESDLRCWDFMMLLHSCYFLRTSSHINWFVLQVDKGHLASVLVFHRPKALTMPEVFVFAKGLAETTRMFKETGETTAWGANTNRRSFGLEGRKRQKNGLKWQQVTTSQHIQEQISLRPTRVTRSQWPSTPKWTEPGDSSPDSTVARQHGQRSVPLFCEQIYQGLLLLAMRAVRPPITSAISLETMLPGFPASRDIFQSNWQLIPNMTHKYTQSVLIWSYIMYVPCIYHVYIMYISCTDIPVLICTEEC